MQPIADGEKFMIHVTEVFHRACVANGRVRESLTVQLRLENAHLRQQVAAAQRDAAEASRLRTAIDDANRDARKFRAERDTFQRNLDRINAHLIGARRELEEERQAREERDRAAARALALRDEMAAQVAEQERQLAAIAGTRATELAADDLDDAATRFRLIELDPLE